MKNEIKEILDNINNKWEDYKEKTKQLEYVQDIVSGNDFKQLLDYITNLQDRIKKLETINEEHRRINGELREENERLKKDYYEEYDTHLKDKTYYFNLFEDYKTRNEKAVDLIIGKIDYDDEYPGYMQMLEVDYNDLLETLQGKSDE